MDLKTLNALPSVKPRQKKKRVGRGTGSGVGKTCGRGHKGAGARSGHRLRDFYEGGNIPAIRKFPKRGFSNALFKKDFAILNVSDLNCFDDGAEITPQLLQTTGLIKKLGSGVKVLGDGELTAKELKVTAHRLSKSARQKLEANGCTVTELVAPKKRKPSKRQFELWQKEREAKKAKGKKAKGKDKKAKGKGKDQKAKGGDDKGKKGKKKG